MSTSSSGNNTGSNSSAREWNIYEITPSRLKELCQYLDNLNVWQQIAKVVDLKPTQIQTIQLKYEVRGASPTEELLKLWGNQYSHTATELFVVLQKLKLYEGMRIIKDFVPRKHHIRIPNSQPKLSSLLLARNSGAKEESSRKILNCSTSSGVSNSNNVTTTDDSHMEISESNSNNSRVYTGSLPEIKYDELTQATDNWKDEFILGKGGFGTVYIGIWRHTKIAIKQIHNSGQTGQKGQVEQILSELKYLDSLRHKNVLPLMGYNLGSKPGETPCLVYEFMEGGTLDQRLHTKRYEPLSWIQRIKICFGTARGLNFLHTCRSTPLIHGDIKPANILLDQCLMPRIGDFGLAREGAANSINSSVEVSKVYGTKPYLPTEFIKSMKLSTKVDTYSFGVVLLEIFCGLRAYDRKREQPHIVDYCSTKNLREVIDKTVPIICAAEVDMICQMLRLGLKCTSETPGDRSEMDNVLEVIKVYYNE